MTLLPTPTPRSWLFQAGELCTCGVCSTPGTKSGFGIASFVLSEPSHHQDQFQNYVSGFTRYRLSPPACYFLYDKGVYLCSTCLNQWFDQVQKAIG